MGVGEGNARGRRTDYFLLSNEKCELVFALVVELAQLDALDFGTNVTSQVIHLGLVTEEVRERRVGIFAVLIKFEWLESGISFRVLLQCSLDL